MKIFIRTLLCFGFLLSTSSLAQTVYLRDLNELSWHFRVILLNGDALPSETLAVLANEKAQTKERQIVWFWRKNTQIETNSFGSLSSNVKTQIAQALENNNVVLIGKDGKIKHQSKDFNLNTILTLIDSMPMRRQEMYK